MIIGLLFIVLSVLAGIEVWLLVMDIAINLTGGPSFIDPEYDNVVFPSLMLVIIIICYFLSAKYLLKKGKKRLFQACIIVTLFFFFTAPWALEIKSNIIEQLYKVSPVSNEEFLKSIQADIDNNNKSFQIDYKKSEERLEDLKTRYVAILIKTKEGRITKDDIKFFLAKDYDKQVNLVFYTKSKDSSIEIYINSDNRITYCYPYEECKLID